jgi:hypothetical protein
MSVITESRFFLLWESTFHQPIGKDGCMKQIFGCICLTSFMLLLSACESNKTLSQGNAEKAIKEVAQHHRATPYPAGWSTFEEGACFNEASIANIEPVSQFADNEATANATFKCNGMELTLKFMFQKDVNKQWFLTKLAIAKQNNAVTREIVKENSDLKVVAQ